MGLRVVLLCLYMPVCTIDSWAGTTFALLLCLYASLVTLPRMEGYIYIHHFVVYCGERDGGRER